MKNFDEAMLLMKELDKVHTPNAGTIEELVEFLNTTADKFAKTLKPFNNKLFGKLPDTANNFMSLNISANILGMSGATTPMGIKSMLLVSKVAQRRVPLSPSLTEEVITSSPPVCSAAIFRSGNPIPTLRVFRVV